MRRFLGPEAASSGNAGETTGPLAGAAARRAAKLAGVGALPPRGLGEPAPAQVKPPKAPQGCRAVPVTSTDGSLWQVLLGKSAEENDRLSLTEGRPHETWMHVAGVPGSHAVVRHVRGADERASPPRDVSEAAASLCAFYSKAKTQPRATVHVTTCGNVGKLPAAPPGQVVLRGRFDALSVRPLSPDQLAQGGAVAAANGGHEAKRSLQRKRQR